MTPAIATGPEASQMRVTSVESVWIFSSRVWIFSPSEAWRTMIFLPPILRASKACRGCPYSIKT